MWDTSRRLGRPNVLTTVHGNVLFLCVFNDGILNGWPEQVRSLRVIKKKNRKRVKIRQTMYIAMHTTYSERFGTLLLPNRHLRRYSWPPIRELTPNATQRCWFLSSKIEISKAYSAETCLKIGFRKTRGEYNWKRLMKDQHPFKRGKTVYAKQTRILKSSPEHNAYRWTIDPIWNNK